MKCARELREGVVKLDHRPGDSLRLSMRYVPFLWSPPRMQLESKAVFLSVKGDTQGSQGRFNLWSKDET
jgi:hypothetical protein